MSNVISKSILDSVQMFSKSYKSAEPFPHIIIDNFFEPDVAEYLYENFPKMEQMPNIFKEPMSYKGQLSDINGKWPKFKHVFDVLQSDSFRGTVSEISNIPNLISDPILAGGGLHQSPKSGFLDLHVDANYHPLNKGMHRRVNIIIYLNKSWERTWGGNLELWDDIGEKPGKIVASVEPKFNRAAIFSTTRTSWHGVSSVNCPEGESRKSLALYYYTSTRPDAEMYQDSSVIWMGGRSIFKRAWYPLLNFVIRLLKPYAKYIRRNVFDATKNKY